MPMLAAVIWYRVFVDKAVIDIVECMDETPTHLTIRSPSDLTPHEVGKHGGGLAFFPTLAEATRFSLTMAERRLERAVQELAKATATLSATRSVCRRLMDAADDTETPQAGATLTLNATDIVALPAWKRDLIASGQIDPTLTTRRPNPHFASRSA